MPSASTLSRVMAVVEIPQRERGWRVLHTFRFPTYNEKGFHRTLTSFESFKRGPPPKRGKVPWNHPQFPGKFKSPAWRADKMFYCAHDDLDDFLDRAESSYNSSYRIGHRPWDERIVPTFHHADLWAFYEHIGWDYKNRVYRDVA